jgi:hypothetical protein
MAGKKQQVRPVFAAFLLLLYTGRALLRQFLLLFRGRDAPWQAKSNRGTCSVAGVTGDWQ